MKRSCLSFAAMLLLGVGAMLPACGSSDSQEGPIGVGGTGGGSDASVGGAAGKAGTGGIAGSAGKQTGGTAGTAGKGGTAGTSQGGNSGAGGSSGGSGTAGQGGSVGGSAGEGGSSTGGTAGSGGVITGGSAGEGGSATGGTAGDGGSGGATGGAAGDGGSGGVITGGSAGDGGSGGVITGGSAGDGGSGGVITGGSAGDGGSGGVITGGSAGDGGSGGVITGGSAGSGGSNIGGAGGAVVGGSAGDGGSNLGGAAGTSVGGSGGSSPSQIIADHTVVAKADNIPQQYLDEVKKMWINIPGESHSAAYRQGLVLLAQADTKFPAVATESGAPEAYTDQHLRVSRSVRNQYNNWSYGTGERQWYTWFAHPAATMPAVEKDLLKNHITYCETHSLHITAIGFGWCWDTTWHNGPGGTTDPDFNVRWAGSSEGGPDGDARWGLDDGDIALTGNRVTMNTYLAATQAYIDYAVQQGYTTKVLFTTGPVDGYTGESGYQRHLKHEHIRNYVKLDSARILFDYADILCYDNSATSPNTTTWSGHTYPIITTANLGAGDVGHIGSTGAIRLGRAMWWMLARIAGWDGN